MLKKLSFNKNLKTYLIIFISLVLISIIVVFADFGDDKYYWIREKNGTEIKFFSENYFTPADIFKILEGVKDPELDINIVDLGLILDIATYNDKINIDMILTTPYCPYSSQIIETIRKQLFEYDRINEISLTVNSEPAWSYDRLTENGKKAVKGFFIRDNHAK